jgi:flavin reductase (DIM6/NTAB) family NADH-FMN oxidoreductase RutF
MAMKIDPTQLGALAAYKLGTSVVIPRPIAWTGTRSEAGVNNLAPFSYFMGVSTRPPSVAISIARQTDGRLKDSAENILATGVFTVSIVSFSHVAQMNQCAAPWPPEVSEFEACGLTAVMGERVAAPRPKEALASMECKLIHSHDLGSTHLLVGEVLMYHLDDSIVVTDKRGDRVVDSTAMDAVCRLGTADYARVLQTFSLGRPRTVPAQ